MAAEAPDPKTFASWEDAFQYPIATVRGMERQLRNDIDLNREKLRSLVGTSYRDLLGTAETILDMNSWMENVENYLGDMGARCNSRLLDRKTTNLRAWNDGIQARDKERYILASQLAVLRGCPEAISRILKDRGSPLLAAKTVVISRLLHKKLSQRTDPPPYLETLRIRLASLRRKLLARIDRRFRSLSSSEAVLVETMCAFSLATSSSATDVLRHFHQVRASTMSELGRGRDDDKGIHRSLKMFVRTLRDYQIIFPTQLARALEGLKAAPLLQAPDFRSLLELDLDIHQRWLGEDVTSFTPYVRHDDLPRSEATKIGKQWAKDAFSTFLEDLRRKLDEASDPKVVANLREQMLELWFSNQRYSMGIEASDVLEGIRNAFNGRLQSLIHYHCGSLKDVASAVAAALDNWKDGVSDACPSIWDNAVLTTDDRSGSRTLKEALSVRAYGMSEPVRVVSSAHARWLDGLRIFEDVIKRLREKKWSDDIDDIDDNDNVLEKKQTLLSEDDPRLMQDTLRRDVEENLNNLQETIHTHTDTLQAMNANGNGTVAPRACFLLRVWRNITLQMPASYSNFNLQPSFIQTLQSQVAQHVTRQPVLRCGKQIGKLSHQNRLQARILWEGDPQLPVLPSPYAFRLLHDLVRSMTALGADIWTPQAVDILKRRLKEDLAPLLEALPKGRRQANGGNSPLPSNDHDPEPDDTGTSASNRSGEDETSQTQMEVTQSASIRTNGDAPAESPGLSDQVSRDITVQRLFDFFYLQCAIYVKESDDADDPFQRAQRSIETSIELPNPDVKRMKRGAEAYWKRTELLFALLA